MKHLLASLFLAASYLVATPLSTLTAGGSVSNGAQTFSNFSFSHTCIGVGACSPVDASGVEVTVTQHGLQFSGGFSAITPGGFTVADTLIAYDVSSLLPIGEIRLLFNGSVSGNLSTAQVVETILVSGPFIAGQMEVNAPSGPVVASLMLDPLYEFRVVKDIFQSAGGGHLAWSTISFVDQLYSREVPEPAAWVLLGVAFLGLSVLRNIPACQ